MQDLSTLWRESGSVMNVGIIGSGLQCKRRIEAIQQFRDDKVLMVGGVNESSLAEIFNRYNVLTTSSPQSVFENPLIDAILICTPPNSHGEYLRKALNAGKKVLVEKPMLKSSVELEDLQKDFFETIHTDVWCGFNHRFHPAIKSLKKHLDENVIGNVIFVRSNYGISARSTYLNEWRSDPKFAAGGQFVEQGSHLLDLLNWIVGRPRSIYCKMTNLIFDNAPLEDGGMAILTFEGGATAQIHTTLAQWHNEFRFEVYGQKGFLKVVGLGNTYGMEQLEIGLREEGKPFRSEVIQFRGSDTSWREEWESFKLAISGRESDIASFQDGLEVMRIAEAAYLSNDKSIEAELFR